LWLPHDPWAQDCHIIVGDQLFDLLYLASRRLIAPQGYGRSTVWLPTALIEGDQLQDVATWLGRAYWPSGGQASAKIISYSLTPDRLEAVGAAISRLTRWPVQTRRLEVTELPFPAEPRNQVRQADSEPQHLVVVEGKVLLSYRSHDFLQRPNAGRVMVDATI